MVARLIARDGAPPTSITPGVWIAVGVAGGIILIALVCMIFLLVRATSSHKRLLADLEQRGIRLGQQHAQLEGNGVTKPRQVLRRNTFLPYNHSTGWGVLPSRESFGHSSLIKIPPTTQAPTIIEPAPSPGHSGHKKVWPFHKRRSHGPKHIKLERIRTSRLSAIIESPRPMLDIPSPVVQEHRENPNENTLRLTLDSTTGSPIEKLCPPPFGPDKPNSAPDLRSALKPAPLFSSPLPLSGTNIRSPRRRARSNSVPSIYGRDDMNKEIQSSSSSQRLGRNFSLIYRQSGLAPESPVPPLPLRLGHTRSISNVDYSPSRRSASSFESATSSILVTASPATSRSPHARMRQSPGHELHKSLVLKGPRPLLPQLQCRNSAETTSTKHFREESIRSNVAQFSIECPSSNPHSRNNSPDSKRAKLKFEGNSQSKMSTHSRSNNSLTGGPPSTPRHTSRHLVSSEGSPTERRRSTTMQDAPVSESILAQQLSRTSTNASSSCSSNGNPFQWDPTPMQSCKPAGPRASPERKKAHRRQNCIRLSTTTGQAGPPVKSETPVVMHGIEEEPGSTHNKKPSDDGELISLDTRPLPRPPSISTFAPELRFEPTNIRASLTEGSPALSLTRYNQENPDCSTRWRNSGISKSPTFGVSSFLGPIHTNSSQLDLAIPEKDAASGISPKKRSIDASARNKDELEYDSSSTPLNYPTLEMPSPKSLPKTSRLATPPSYQLKLSQTDSAPCSPKTLCFKSVETTPGDLYRHMKATSSVPDLPPRDPRRSEISPTRAGLTGPRTEPGRDLRKTVAALRRMNSDADDDSRTSRRYRQLGREPTNTNLADDTVPSPTSSATPGASPTKAGRESRIKPKHASGAKVFSSPSQQFVPTSTYSLISPPPFSHRSAATSSSALTVSTAAPSHASTTFTTSTSRTSITTATPPAPAASSTPTFGLGLNLGPSTSTSGSAFDRNSMSSHSLTAALALHPGGDNSGASIFGGDDSCTSLTDLILAESENIFGPRELEEANSAKAGDAGDAEGGARPGSRVWDDGGEEGFWKSPSTRERERGRGEMVFRTPVSRSSRRASAAAVIVAEDVTAGAGPGVRVASGASGVEEFFDSDAENKTPTTVGGGAAATAGAKEEREGKRRGGSGAGREVLAPMLRISVQPPSEQGTPQSLYDRDGFLR